MEEVRQKMDIIHEAPAPSPWDEGREVIVVDKEACCPAVDMSAEECIGAESVVLPCPKEKDESSIVYTEVPLPTIRRRRGVQEARKRSKRFEKTARVYGGGGRARTSRTSRKDTLVKQSTPKAEWQTATGEPRLYNAVEDWHCTYISGKLFEQSPYHRAEIACLHGYKQNLLRTHLDQHVPAWSKSDHHYYPLDSVLAKPRMLESAISNKNCSRSRSSHSSSGQERQRKKQERKLVEEASMYSSFAMPSMYPEASRTHFSSRALRPHTQSLGSTGGALHFESVSNKHWLQLPSQARRAFHDDAWIDIVRADAIQALHTQYERDCAAIRSPSARLPISRLGRLSRRSRQ